MQIAPTAPVSFAEEDLVPLVNLARQVVQSYSQLVLSDSQFSMISSRLIRRIYQLQLSSPQEYCDYIELNRKSEATVLISLLTTHHTLFFREFEQFEFLVTQGLNDVISSLRRQNRKTINVASLACSRGHEVYTIAMFLSSHLAMIAPDLEFKITGLDIDPDSVAVASNGVYHWEEVKAVPAIYALSSWHRGSGAIKDFVRISDHLKRNCDFKVGNLLDPVNINQALSAKGNFDLIFCRNVFLYFTDEQIFSSVNTILEFLDPAGYFFVGISESLVGRGLPLISVGKSIYSHDKGLQKRNEGEKISNHGAPIAKLNERNIGKTPQASEQPLRILCVDDSATILSLLKAILTKEHGFQVVATARSGIEARQKLSQHSIDAMTLDIHMPDQGGIEYLEENFGSNHPPVVILSSLERDQEEVGRRALTLGATDYIEKPSLENLNRSGEEIRAKLWSAAVNCKSRSSRAVSDEVAKIQPSVQEQFSNSINFIRVVLCTERDRLKIIKIASRSSRLDPPLLIITDCSEITADQLRHQIVDGCGKSVHKIPRIGEQAVLGAIYLGNISAADGFVLSWCQSRKACVFVCDGTPPSAKIIISKLASSKIFTEGASYRSGVQLENPRLASANEITVESFVEESMRYFQKA